MNGGPAAVDDVLFGSWSTSDSAARVVVTAAVMAVSARAPEVPDVLLGPDVLDERAADDDAGDDDDDDTDLSEATFGNDEDTKNSFVNEKKRRF